MNKLERAKLKGSYRLMKSVNCAIGQIRSDQLKSGGDYSLDTDEAIMLDAAVRIRRGKFSPGRKYHEQQSAIPIAKDHFAMQCDTRSRRAVFIWETRYLRNGKYGKPWRTTSRINLDALESFDSPYVPYTYGTYRALAKFDIIKGVMGTRKDTMVVPIYAKEEKIERLNSEPYRFFRAIVIERKGIQKNPKLYVDEGWIATHTEVNLSQFASTPDECIKYMRKAIADRLGNHLEQEKEDD